MYMDRSGWKKAVLYVDTIPIFRFSAVQWGNLPKNKKTALLFLEYMFVRNKSKNTPLKQLMHSCMENDAKNKKWMKRVWSLDTVVYKNKR
jgi:hypothetical protein